MARRFSDASGAVRRVKLAERKTPVKAPRPSKLLTFGGERDYARFMLREPIHLALVAVVVALGAGCSLILDFDDPVGESADGGPSDAGGTDGPPVIIDAPVSLACGLFEPNDTIESAASLTEAMYEVGLCPAASDVDYYRLDLTQGSDKALSVLAEIGATGSVVLYDALGMDTVAAGQDLQGDGSYFFELTVAPGIYILKIAGSAETTGDISYSLTVAVNDPPAPDAGA